MINNTQRTEIINALLSEGVEIPCPDGVIIEETVKIKEGTVILPNTVITGATQIGKNCIIGPNSYICDTVVGDNTKLNNTQSYNSQIGSGVTAGPFVHIRPNCRIADNVHIGNFVEVKNSTVDEGSKLPHLLYVLGIPTWARM